MTPGQMAEDRTNQIPAEIKTKIDLYHSESLAKNIVIKEAIFMRILHNLTTIG